MKTKEETFKQKWNLPTLRKIREEFCDSKYHLFLCSGSPTFRELWKNHRDEIVELGLAFSDSAKMPLSGGRNVLFYYESGIGYGDEISVRLAFLDSEIAKKTKKAKKK